MMEQNRSGAKSVPVIQTQGEKGTFGCMILSGFSNLKVGRNKIDSEVRVPISQVLERPNSTAVYSV